MNIQFMLWYFIVYSILGWIMETAFVSIKEKRPVNRGFLLGCCCPIYGFGMCAILLFLLPVRNNFPAVFFIGMTIATLLEYFTGWIMEKLFHARWWDYSKRFGNINGRICFTTSLAWGGLSLVMIAFVHPKIEQVVSSLSLVLSFALLSFLYFTLLFDCIYSAIGAAKLSLKIRSLNDIKTELNSMIENVDFTEKIGELIAKHNHIVGNFQFLERRLLSAFPHVNQMKILQKLNHIKEELHERLKGM